jgi:hypothetical protein
MFSGMANFPQTRFIANQRFIEIGQFSSLMKQKSGIFVLHFKLCKPF